MHGGVPAGVSPLALDPVETATPSEPSALPALCCPPRVLGVLCDAGATVFVTVGLHCNGSGR